VQLTTKVGKGLEGLLFF